jgi:decaprenylphospho-beta-D-erythro-pentofuranosid-2-ulose 2-reductase
VTGVRPAADAAVATAPAGVRRVLLIGGSSDIGLAIVRRLATDGPVVASLLGRDRARLEAAQRLLQQDGVTSEGIVVVDAGSCESHEQAVASAFETARGFDVVVIAVGRLGGQAGLDADPRESVEVMRVTFLGAGSLMLHCLQRLREQGGGTLIVLSSVAAERPRAGNPVYGAAKAGLDALGQGLGDAAVGTGVRVLVVRPGFVRTRMTAGLPAPPMAAAAEQVADATVRALAGRAHTVWVPGRLRYIFAVLRHLPRSIFRRLAL